MNTTRVYERAMKLTVALLFAPSCGDDGGPGAMGATGEATMGAPTASGSASATDAGSTGSTGTAGDDAGSGSAAAASTGETVSSSGGADTGSTTEPAACEEASADECIGCRKGACCEDLTACEQDPDCWACVEGIDGDVCEANAETHARVQAYLSCRAGSCQADCLGEPGSTCEAAAAELPEGECTSCIVDACCDLLAACHDNAICWTGCFNEHDSEVCHTDPDGHAIYHGLSSCIARGCGSAC